MSNTSATGGYLPPQPSPSPVPLEDAALVAFLQQIFVGLTGLPGSMVRPRWQPVPPNRPSITDAWMAFGIQNRTADTFAYTFHNSAGDGSDIMARNEALDVMCSFYGPTGDTLAGLVRDGLAIPQNREALLTSGMALIDCGDTLAVPEVVNAQWYYRVDMTVRVRRAVIRTYPVLNLLSAAGTLSNGTGQTDSISVNHP